VEVLVATFALKEEGLLSFNVFFFQVLLLAGADKRVFRNVYREAAFFEPLTVR